MVHSGGLRSAAAVRARLRFGLPRVGDGRSWELAGRALVEACDRSQAMIADGTALHVAPGLVPAPVAEVTEAVVQASGCRRRG